MKKEERQKMIKDAIERILNEYGSAKKDKIANHELASYIKIDFPGLLKKLIKDPDEYEIVGSAGIGLWARCPWIAILDPSITKTVQAGFFPMYVFREDLSGAYLSLNQGIKKILLKHKKKTKNMLRSEAQVLFNKIEKKPQNFPLTKIDLTPSDNTNPSAYYEAANVCACFYNKENLPSEEELKRDLNNIMDIYVSLKKDYTSKSKR